MTSMNPNAERCPYFREIEEKLRNNDIGSADRYRFVKRPRCLHDNHPSNTNPTVLNPLKCGGDVAKCEIHHIWQT